MRENCYTGIVKQFLLHRNCKTVTMLCLSVEVLLVQNVSAENRLLQKKYFIKVIFFAHYAVK